MKKFWSKIPKWVKVSVAVLVVICLLAYGGIGWYFSNQLLIRKPDTVAFDQTVQAIQGTNYTISGSAYNEDGIMGAIRKDGSPVGLFSAPLSKNDATKTSVRRLIEANNKPTPVKGEKIALEGNIWTTDPKTALGIDYQAVTYESPLGPMGAWIIPVPHSTVWTIAVHGIGSPKTEMLRFIKPVQAAGDTMMIINYRGDKDNPPSPDGYTHLGDTEWQDLEAAVRYAKDHGATTINLYATSLGGSITENYLRRSADVTTSHIKKVVLDSPALDWNEILRFQVKKLGYPAFLSQPGMTVASLRSGLDFNRITTRPGSLKQPTLLIHNQNDNTVPQAASKKVAAAQPDLVQFVDFGTGGHIRAWNHDPVRYEKLVTDFLKQ